MMFVVWLSSAPSSASMCYLLFKAPADELNVTENIYKDFNNFKRIQFQKWGPVNFNRGRKHLILLDYVNEKLSNPKITLEQMAKEVKQPLIIFKSPVSWTQNKFIEARIPLIGTSILLPNPKVNKFIPGVHQAIVVVIPGTGTNKSTASTVFHVGQTFYKHEGKGSFHPAWGDQMTSSNQIVHGFRAISVIFDPPGNSGYGKGAYEILTTADGVLSSMRLVQLIVQRLFPDLPFIFTGRSQGGLQALAYAHLYGPEDGVIHGLAINPSPTSRAALMDSNFLQEKDGSIVDTVGSKSHPIAIDPLMWLAHSLYTVDFNFIFQQPAKASTTLIYSPNDTLSYKMQTYQPWANSYHNTQLKQETIAVPEELNAPHDLWHQKNNKLYRWTTDLMAEKFIHALRQYNN